MTDKPPNYDLYMDDLKKKIPTPPPLPKPTKKLIGKEFIKVAEKARQAFEEEERLRNTLPTNAPPPVPSEIEGEIYNIVADVINAYFRRCDLTTPQYSPAIPAIEIRDKVKKLLKSKGVL